MYGVVDLGSNTMRLNIYKYNNGEITQMLSKKFTAGLAGYINDAGYLTSRGMDKAVQNLIEFKNTLEALDVKETFIFATASLRNIKNSAEAKKHIEKKTGLQINILSGEEEATLDYVGASLMLTLEDGLLIDIGGGSTEVVLYQNGAIQNAVSLPVGSLSLHNQYVKEFLPKKDEIKRIEKRILKELKKLQDPALVPNSKIICGVGGTVRGSSQFINELFDLADDNKTIVVKDMDRILDHYFENRYDFVSRLIKVIPDRLHTILPGMIVLNTLAKHFGSEVIFVSEFGVREGYLYRKLHGQETVNDQQ